MRIMGQTDTQHGGLSGSVHPGGSQQTLHTIYIYIHRVQRVDV